MENNTLLGAIDSEVSYDGSGVFNPNVPTPVPTSTSAPASTDTGSKPADNTSDKPTESNNTGLLLYAGIALAAYFFFFKKK